MAATTQLSVLLHGEPIAVIQRLPDDRTILFFEHSYMRNPDRPTLSLGFKAESGDLITEFRPTRAGMLPPFFSNLLPEGAMRNYLAQKARVNPSREFFLLGVLGKDLPGGVTIESPELEAELGLAGDPAVLESARTEQQEATLRFSLAGIQLKFSAVQEASGGLTIPAKGVGGEWIVKLPSALYPHVPENEFSMMELARQSGLDVPEVRLVNVEDIAQLPEGIGNMQKQALAIRRFDRQTNRQPIHIEDFAQVFGLYPDDKYSKASYRNLAEVLLIEAGEEAVKEFVRRLVFSAMIGNADMHLKNWSLIYPDRRTPTLSPAYDLVSTIAYIPDDTRMALSMAGIKEMRTLTWERLEAFIADARLPRTPVLNTVEDMVSRFREAWARSKDHLPLHPRHAEAIANHFPAVPIVTGKAPK